ncbi:MAG TPA: hypothetical protein VER11_29635 [Polyangiaceae bacterium]|nr:hypothetical protein [Polyangiaceae bacterium]
MTRVLDSTRHALPELFALPSGAVDLVRRDGDREQWLTALERGGQ